MKKKIIILLLVLSVLLLTVITTLSRKKPDFSNITLTVGSSQDLSGGVYFDGAKKFEEDFGCTVEFVQDTTNCDLVLTYGEDFSGYQPINKYVNLRNNLYTKSIIRENCMEDGNIYGVSHVLMGNLNYCTYNPDQFSGFTLPFDYYKKGEWTWDSFISMTNDLNANIAVDWTKSYINMKYSLFRGKDGVPTFNYGTQEQIEWLNFVRTLIYDDGIVNNTEGAFKVDFFPALIHSAVDSDVQMRYIPWPTKTGKLGTMFVDEYHFCVPKAAQNPELSVKLANYMIESCIDTRTALYQSAMTEEDWKLFKKQLKKIYTYPPHSDYVPAQKFIEDFIHGKTVTEHIYNVENDAGHIN